MRLGHFWRAPAGVACGRERRAGVAEREKGNRGQQKRQGVVRPRLLRGEKKRQRLGMAPLGLKRGAARVGCSSFAEDDLETTG